MKIDPQIAALRVDKTPQRHAQRALEAARDGWREGTGKQVLDDLRRYGEGAELADCAALARVIADSDAATAFLAPLLDGGIAALSAHPLGHVPMRHQYVDSLALIQLGQTGRAQLTLLAYEEFMQSPATASFSGGDCHEIILAGAADVRLLTLLGEREGRAAIELQTRRLVAGEGITCRGYEETRTIERVHGRMVVLRLARTDVAPRETRQYALEDGRLVHCASGTRDESQREMAMALLGRMGRRDAAPLLAALSLEGTAHIRWQSLRECLALDSAAGFAALSRIAANLADELSAPAGALRAQLVEQYPELAQTEAARCPA